MRELASFFIAAFGLVNRSRCDCVQVQKRDEGVGGSDCRKGRDGLDVVNTVVNSRFNLAKPCRLAASFCSGTKCVG